MATAEKIGTENGLAPCALLLMFGRTVGLSLSIRSIPPAEQEMNLSANMIKAEGLWRTVGREYEGKGRPNRKAGKEKNGPPMNGKGVPRGRSHLGLLDFVTLRSKGIVGYSVYIRNSVFKLLTGIEIDIFDKTCFLCYNFI